MTTRFLTTMPINKETQLSRQEERNRHPSPWHIQEESTSDKTNNFVSTLASDYKIKQMLEHVSQPLFTIPVPKLQVPRNHGLGLSRPATEYSPFCISSLMYKWGSLAPHPLASSQLKEAERLSTAIDFPFATRILCMHLQLKFECFCSWVGLPLQAAAPCFRSFLRNRRTLFCGEH